MGREGKGREGEFLSCNAAPNGFQRMSRKGISSEKNKIARLYKDSHRWCSHNSDPADGWIRPVWCTDRSPWPRSQPQWLLSSAQALRFQFKWIHFFSDPVSISDCRYYEERGRGRRRGGVSLSSPVLRWRASASLSWDRQRIPSLNLEGFSNANCVGNRHPILGILEDFPSISPQGKGMGSF